MHLAQQILCVAPDAKARALLQEALADYQFVVAVSGYEALREINRRAFYAYVLDYWVPHWSGIAACKQIRALDPNVPIVFCTAAPDRERVRVFRAGANGYFPVPMDPTEFRLQLKVLLETADLNSARARPDAGLAIYEELQRCAAVACERTAVTRISWDSSIERIVKIKALDRYLKAGGTTTHFDASWQSTFSGARAVYRVGSKAGVLSGS